MPEVICLDPYCERRVDCPADLIGKPVRCRFCNSVFTASVDPAPRAVLPAPRRKVTGNVWKQLENGGAVMMFGSLCLFFLFAGLLRTIPDSVDYLLVYRCEVVAAFGIVGGFLVGGLVFFAGFIGLRVSADRDPWKARKNLR